MDANVYQAKTSETELYTDAAMEFIGETLNAGIHTHAVNVLSLMYCVGKLNGEAGEAAEIVFKAFRGNGGELTDEEVIKLAKELGDIAWYCARIADLIGYGFSDILEMNIAKLADRKERGQVHGYGDER